MSNFLLKTKNDFDHIQRLRAEFIETRIRRQPLDGNVERFSDDRPNVINNCQRVPRSRCCSLKSNITF